MPKGISLHVGVANPQQPHCGVGDFPAAEDEARAFEALAQDARFSPRRVLTGAAATRVAVLREIRQAAGALRQGDIFFLTFCGHGCQRLSDGNDVELDGYDETLCLHDVQLTDDELHREWALFSPGVRILFIADCCHAGTMMADAAGEEPVAASPARVERLTQLREPLSLKRKRGWKLSRTAADMVLPRRDDRAPIEASVLLLAACRERQEAQGNGDGRGLFTAQVMKVWDDGGFPANGTYQTFIRKVRNAVSTKNPDQTPGIALAGRPMPEFVRQRPFTI